MDSYRELFEGVTPAGLSAPPCGARPARAKGWTSWRITREGAPRGPETREGPENPENPEIGGRRVLNLVKVGDRQ